MNESVAPFRPVTPWLDHGVYSATASTSRNASGMDAGIEYRHDGGEEWGINCKIWQSSLDKRTKLFYVRSTCLPLPGRGSRAVRSRGDKCGSPFRVVTDNAEPGCGCVLAQGSGYYGPDAREGQ